MVHPPLMSMVGSGDTIKNVVKQEERLVFHHDVNDAWFDKFTVSVDSVTIADQVISFNHLKFDYEPFCISIYFNHGAVKNWNSLANYLQQNTRQFEFRATKNVQPKSAVVVDRVSESPRLRERKAICYSEDEKLNDFSFVQPEARSRPVKARQLSPTAALPDAQRVAETRVKSSTIINPVPISSSSSQPKKCKPTTAVKPKQVKNKPPKKLPRPSPPLVDVVNILPLEALVEPAVSPESTTAVNSPPQDPPETPPTSEPKPEVKETVKPKRSKTKPLRFRSPVEEETVSSTVVDLMNNGHDYLSSNPNLDVKKKRQKSKPSKVVVQNDTSLEPTSTTSIPLSEEMLMNNSVAESVEIVSTVSQSDEVGGGSQMSPPTGKKRSKASLPTTPPDLYDSVIDSVIKAARDEADEPTSTTSADLPSQECDTAHELNQKQTENKEEKRTPVRSVEKRRRSKSPMPPTIEVANNAMEVSCSEQSPSVRQDTTSPGSGTKKRRASKLKAVTTSTPPVIDYGHGDSQNTINPPPLPVEQELTVEIPNDHGRGDLLQPMTTSPYLIPSPQLTVEIAMDHETGQENQHQNVTNEVTPPSPKVTKRHDLTKSSSTRPKKPQPKPQPHKRESPPPSSFEQGRDKKLARSQMQSIRRSDVVGTPLFTFNDQEFIAETDLNKYIQCLFDKLKTGSPPARPPDPVYSCFSTGVKGHKSCDFTFTNWHQLKQHFDSSADICVQCSNRPVCKYASTKKLANYKFKHTKLCNAKLID